MQKPCAQSRCQAWATGAATLGLALAAGPHRCHWRGILNGNVPTHHNLTCHQGRSTRKTSHTGPLVQCHLVTGTLSQGGYSQTGALVTAVAGGGGAGEGSSRAGGVLSFGREGLMTEQPYKHLVFDRTTAKRIGK